MGKIKTVYLIASHKYPEQVYQLVKTIENGSPNTTVVLHHDYLWPHNLVGFYPSEVAWLSSNRAMRRRIPLVEAEMPPFR